MSNAIGRRAAMTLSVAATLGLPAIGRAAQNTLRYVPYSNLIVFDPVWAISIIGLEHAYMTCDQLFGLDESFVVQPQMAAGHELSDDKLRWRITLRDGLVFHDGEKVRAVDCVASISRWSKRDPFGVRMAALLDEMTAIDDKTFEIRLKRPYAHMLYGLGATTCFIRPERLAKTDIGTQITDATGSGPFRFLANEFVTGDHAAYVAARWLRTAAGEGVGMGWRQSRGLRAGGLEVHFGPSDRGGGFADRRGGLGRTPAVRSDRQAEGVARHIGRALRSVRLLRDSVSQQRRAALRQPEAGACDPSGIETGRLHAGRPGRPAGAVATWTWGCSRQGRRSPRMPAWTSSPASATWRWRRS